MLRRSGSSSLYTRALSRGRTVGDACPYKVGGWRIGLADGDEIATPASGFAMTASGEEVRCEVRCEVRG